MAEAEKIADGDADSIAYNGCEIVCRVYQLEATENWSAQVLIRHDRRPESRDESFTSSDAWLTREEALGNAVQFGKRVVDGYVPDLTWEHDQLDV